MKFICLCSLIAIALLIGCAPQPHIDHDPPEPDLPAARSRLDRSFRLAAHTLFLDVPIAQLAVQAGFDTIVQVFPWRDLQPRPDYFAWQAADDMVRVAETHQLDLVVRLDMPPFWATRADPEQPPFNTSAYLDFVEAVAARYRGYVTGYIIHNEPNLAEEWGGWVADPQQYAELLCAAFDRVRGIDPEAKVIVAGLAPTNEFSYRAMDDRAFLQQMLQTGAARCFDIFAAHDYGYGLPPNDPHGEHAGLNLARLIDLRDILLKANATQPVWITELGYTIQPGLHPHVSPQEQADYLLGALQRVRAEWPWVTTFTVWNLSYTGGTDEMRGFSIIEPDRSPRAAYHVIAQLRALIGE
ncbi:MAG: hypothetical protein HY870_21255 [Chloroflexi bacterium]|nr:hypothetical protein [Chloroflexota bacterium]